MKRLEKVRERDNNDNTEEKKVKKQRHEKIYKQGGKIKRQYMEKIRRGRAQRLKFLKVKNKMLI